jgi:hypothetical protein
MALICPVCKSRNRSIAKFCIECITSLPPGCSDSEFAPTVRAGPEPPHGNLARPSGVRRATSPAAKGDSANRAAPASKGLGISTGGLIACLMIGSAGWLVAGAAGWHLFAAGSTQVDPPRPVSAAVPEPPHPAQARGEPGLPVPETPPAAAVPESHRPKASPAADPKAACSAMNFIAAAQCMASQCQKPAFKSHAQCETVRRRQQLEEAKRNPFAP